MCGQRDRLTDLRIRQNREFFNVAPQIALDIFNDIASTIDDAEVILYKFYLRNHQLLHVLHEVICVKYTTIIRFKTLKFSNRCLSIHSHNKKGLLL